MATSLVVVEMFHYGPNGWNRRATEITVDNITSMQNV